MSEAGGSIPKHPCCRGTRRDGSPCRAPGLLDGWCFAHHPGRVAERQAAREKGGRSKASTARLDRLVPATLRPMIADLLAAMGEVHAGTLDPKQATAMAALAGAVVRAYGVGVLEERVAALEAQPDLGSA